VLAADIAPSSLAGLEVVDRRGERLGRVRQVYRDGGALGWVGVRGNLFGTEEVLVPLDGAVLEDDVIGVPVMRGRFQTAPRRRPDAALEDGEREQLRSFWSAPVATEEEGAEEEGAEEEGAEEEAGAAVAGSEEAGVMIASEERLRVDVERVPRTRVRLKKVVVTEERTLTVPVRREEYRLIREPITDGAAVADGVLAPDEQEVVLHEERVVLRTEVVPVERVRLLKEEVVEHREVSGVVRRERIDLEDDGAVHAGRGGTPAEHVDEQPSEPGAQPPQPAARAIATKRSTSSRSPRRPGSTPARSSTSAAAEAPPSTGASD
jgi:uncharacterized protein (TIGR02271 family)